MFDDDYFFKGFYWDEENPFAWRMYDHSQDRSFVFAHRTAFDKIQMMDALEYERAYVEENSSKGLDIPLSTRLKVQEHLADQSSPSMVKQSTKKRKKKKSFFFIEIIHFRPFNFGHSSNEHFTV